MGIVLLACSGTKEVAGEPHSSRCCGGNYMPVLSLGTSDARKQCSQGC